MFKFVVLCALLAAASGTPGAIIAPLGYSSNILAPAKTFVSSYPSNVVYSSPVVSSAPLAYSAPWGYSHLIKKRSPQLAVSSYVASPAYIAPAPLATTYTAPLTTAYAATPLATTYAAAPLATTYSSPIYATTAHLIKKRSVAFATPSAYVAPSEYVSSYVPSTYAAVGPYISTPLISSAPIAYTHHFIKKRSVALGVAAYTAPTSYSHQSRFDYQSSSPAVTYTSYAAPLAYSRPVSYL